MTPSRRSLDLILNDCGINLPNGAVDALWAYHQMLREANARLNLTRIHQFDNMVLKHYVDSLLVLRFEELPDPIVDMGSGPGLPGIPLAIARPGVRMILAEPRGARAEFLQEVVNRLNLKHVEVYANKVNRKFPFEVQGIITRAVASIPETLTRVARAIIPGGKMLLMKGPDCHDEIAEAKQTHAGLFKLVANHAYSIPGTTHERRLVVYERLNTPVPVADDGDEEAPARMHSGPLREVTSDTNPMIKLARELLGGRGIRKHGQALFAGTRTVDEVLERWPDRVDGWITNPNGPPPPESILNATWYRVSDALLKELDVAGTHAPILLVKAPALPQFNDSDPWPEGCTLFIPFQDPENVGAVLRTAAAFGVTRAVLLKESAHPYHPKSLRAAGPAVFQVELLQGPSIKEIEISGAPLIALDASGTDLEDSPFPPIFGLIPGVEGPGLPLQLRQSATRRIPIAPGVESLNAATATAIALYAWKRQK